MTEAITVALISGGLSLAGVIYANSRSSREMEHKLDKAQALTNQALSELTREVREHNGFARRMPVVEEQICAIHHRLDGLEKQGG